MKKFKKFLVVPSFMLLVLALILSAPHTTFAEEDKWERWQAENFGVSFYLPKGFEEVKNEDDVFVVANDRMILAVALFKSKDVTTQDVFEAAVKAVQEQCEGEVKLSEDATYEKELSGLNTIITYATCKEADFDKYVGIAGMINTENDDNLIVYVIYNAEDATDEDIDMEKDIIESFGVIGVNE